MTALVTKHLPLVAGAPDGVKKLRALILELAVRGRLVNQDSSDEPAIEFFKRLTFAKSEFEASRSRRSLQENQQASVSVHPFQAPAGWMWTTFGAATICRDGERVPVSQVDREGRDKIYDYYGASGAIDKIDNYLFDKPLLLIGEDGANLINRSTPIAFIARGRYWVNNHAHVIDGISEAYLEYLALYINAIDLKPYVTGTAQPKMNQAKLNSIPVPLPPEREQKRIVAKVDELMALCDRLEADQADAEAAHAQLVQALLDSLTQATDAADFRASWQRLSEHFHTLFTTEASIDALKQTVLQLAVMGKLVPQASDDEPAVELLSRLAKANTAQRRTSPLGDSSSSPKPYELPSGWCWTTLPEVGELARGKSKHRPRNDPALYSGGTIPLVQTGDVARANGVIYTSTGKYNATGLAQSRLWPRGTMCITIAANIADSAILGFDACFPDSVVGFIPGLPELDVRYFEYFLRTAKADLQKFAPSTAQKNINLEILGSIYLPLPPAAELTRIVAKVDELMALCDQLKAQLAEARQQHAQLATVLVEQAVA